jgi:hypothetical protein
VVDVRLGSLAIDAGRPSIDRWSVANITLGD